MKTYMRFFLVIFISCISINSFAQFARLIAFAPKGEKFTLYIGGTKQNSEPADRVEGDVPGGPTFKIKIIFEDPTVKEISKTVFNKPNYTFFYKVEKNAKGAFTLESTSSEWSDVTPKAATPPPPAKEEKQATSSEKPKSEAEPTTTDKGCTNPMSEVDFAVALAGITSYPFEPNQLSAAKKMAESHCLTVWEVVEVINTFEMESSRLSFAKFAYDHTYDKADYSDVKDALHSSKSKSDLEAYIAGKKK